MTKTTPRMNDMAYEFVPVTDERRYLLSAPAKGGYRETFIGLFEVQVQAAKILGIVEPSEHGSMVGLATDRYARAVASMIGVESPDGGTTYCYATQADADADQDGAYAVQYSEAV